MNVHAEPPVSDHHVEILLVEDSPADAEMTIRALRRRGLGNRLVWVRDGVEALDFLAGEEPRGGPRHGNPRLLLLDLKMPRLDGLQTLQRLKEDPRTRSIPVVMMTSSREEADLVESYRLGVNSFIVKPVDFNAFAEVVAQVGMYWMLSNEAPA